LRNVNENHKDAAAVRPHPLSPFGERLHDQEEQDPDGACEQTDAKEMPGVRDAAGREQDEEAEEKRRGRGRESPVPVAGTTTSRPLPSLQPAGRQDGGRIHTLLWLSQTDNSS